MIFIRRRLSAGIADPCTPGWSTA